MQEYKKKTKKGQTTQDVTLLAHAAVAGGQCSRGIQASICRRNQTCGTTNVVVFRLPWTLVLGFQSGVPNSSDK